MKRKYNTLPAFDTNQMTEYMEFKEKVGKLISNMGKMAGLRKHAEVLVRKILDIWYVGHLAL